MKLMTFYQALLRPGVRIAAPALLMLTLCTVLLTPVFAQDDTNRQLTVGDVVTATLDSENFNQVYTVAASQGDTLTVSVSTDAEDLAPTLQLVDQRGNVVAQDIDLATPATADLANISVPTTGTYYIIVARGSGAEGDASGNFTLNLSGTQQVGGQSVTLENGGIDIEMGWNAAVDLNVEVRDPVGGTVHAFSPGSPSGGALDANVNEVCDTATADSPTEIVAWPAGPIPAGSYEIIVYYIDGCSIGGPQLFTLDTTVNGETTQSITGTLNPSQKYLARLIIEPDGTWRLENGGVNAGIDVTIFQNEIAGADNIAIGSTVSGVITNDQPATAYTFDATAGQSVTVSLDAQTGSLDSYLALLGPDNATLDINDDALEGTTNSAITRAIAVDGTYTILATRYGLNIGGTEGEYRLTLSAAAEIPTGVDSAQATPIPDGATEVVSSELPAGSIEVKLTWPTNADIQLSVRDPFGETVYDDAASIRSGGVLYSDGNRQCTDTTTSPVSYIYWPENRLTAGVYEVEVWYQSTCDDNSLVTFNLSVDVGDQTIINTDQESQLASQYMITFTVNQDGTATAGPGGFFNMESASTLNYQTVLDTASQITYGQTVSGSITDRQRSVIYAFDAVQGDRISVGMDQTGGTLDPAIYLIAPDGTQIEYNDDILPNGENRNSAITDKVLAFTGTYYVIATHYGLNYGGTQGTYTLSLVQE